MRFSEIIMSSGFTKLERSRTAKLNRQNAGHARNKSCICQIKTHRKSIPSTLLPIDSIELTAYIIILSNTNLKQRTRLKCSNLQLDAQAIHY
jgi:hypothetical protein